MDNAQPPGDSCPMERAYYVYVLFRPWNGHPFYIGKGKGRRWLDHERDTRRPNKHVAAIIAKARARGSDIPKVKIREGLTEAEAFAIERAFISAIGRAPNGPLANATDGGDGSAGHRVRAGIAARSGERMKAQWRDPVWRAKTIAHAQSRRYPGRKLSDEHRKKISRGNKGKPGSHLGRKFSAEHRKNISDAIRAHWVKRRMQLEPR